MSSRPSGYYNSRGGGYRDRDAEAGTSYHRRTRSPEDRERGQSPLCFRFASLTLRCHLQVIAAKMSNEVDTGMLTAIERIRTAHTGVDMQMMALATTVSRGKTGNTAVHARRNAYASPISREQKDSDMHLLVVRETTCPLMPHGTAGQVQPDDRDIRVARGIARVQAIRMDQFTSIRGLSRTGLWIGEPSRKGEGSESWSAP